MSFAQHLRPRWYWLYFVLAAFDLLTLSFSRYLNHRLRETYTESIHVNQKWAARLNRYADLAQLAGSVNAPGNDVFDSQDPAGESERLKMALENFNRAFAVAQDDLAGLESGESEPLLSVLAQVRLAMDEMTDQAGRIFREFRHRRREAAGAHMASMDRKYARLGEVFFDLNQAVREIQKAKFAAQESLATVLLRFEILIACGIALIVVGVTLYGYKMARSMMAAQREREDTLAALQDSEGRIRDFMENATDLIQSVAPDGSFLYVNRAWREALGYSEAEVKNLSIFQIIHPDHRAQCMQAFERLMAGETLPRIEAVFVAKNGKAITVEGSTSCRFTDGHPLATRGIFQDVTVRKRYELELKSFNETLERKVSERTAEGQRLVKKLRALTAELLLEERERRQLAADLHDDLAQRLALIRIKLTHLDRNTDSANAPADAVLREIKGLVGQADKQVRSLTFQLSPPMLEQFGLMATVEWLAEEMARHYRLHVDIEGQTDPIPLDPHLRFVLFRSVRELLINAAKHAQTDSAQVRLLWQPDRVQIEVEDKGKGFEVSRLDTDAEGSGFGLFSLREAFLATSYATKEI